ncbi:MAG: hypothetical protein RIR26_2273 [Pseudomonadota bacterium]
MVRSFRQEIIKSPRKGAFFCGLCHDERQVQIMGCAVFSKIRSQSLTALLVSLVTSLAACEARKLPPPAYGARTAIPTPTASAQAPVLPAPTAPRSNSNASSDGSSGSCGAGREAATPELRDCCRQQRWGDACNGPCWDAGAAEKLRRVCVAGQTPSEPVKDCGQSPARENTQAWCDFHFNRRYCGVSDADWLKACRPQTP